MLCVVDILFEVDLQWHSVSISLKGISVGTNQWVSISNSQRNQQSRNSCSFCLHHECRNVWSIWLICYSLSFLSFINIFHWVPLNRRKSNFALFWDWNWWKVEVSRDAEIPDVFGYLWLSELHRILFVGPCSGVLITWYQSKTFWNWDFGNFSRKCTFSDFSTEKNWIRNNRCCLCLIPAVWLCCEFWAVVSSGWWIVLTYFINFMINRSVRSDYSGKYHGSKFQLRVISMLIWIKIRYCGWVFSALSRNGNYYRRSVKWSGKKSKRVCSEVFHINWFKNVKNFYQRQRISFNMGIAMASKEIGVGIENSNLAACCTGTFFCWTFLLSPF